MDSIGVKEMDELQKAGDYLAVKNTVKGRSTLLIILGVLNVIFGLIFSLAMDPLNILLVLIGIFLLGVGVWSRTAQSISSLLFAGIALCILGAWNVIVTILNIVGMIAAVAEGEGFSYPGIGFAIVWAVYQFIIGIDSFNRYRRYSSMTLTKPSPETAQRIDQIVKTIIATDANKDTGIILFNKPGTWSQAVWGAQLCNNDSCSVFASANKDDIFFVRPNDVVITQTGKFRKLLKANFNIRGYKFNGTIDPSYFARYDQWKKATLPAAF